MDQLGDDPCAPPEEVDDAVDVAVHLTLDLGDRHQIVEGGDRSLNDALKKIFLDLNHHAPLNCFLDVVLNDAHEHRGEHVEHDLPSVRSDSRDVGLQSLVQAPLVHEIGLPDLDRLFEEL